MKRHHLLWAVLCLSFLLTGCGIGGFWMNGDPFAAKNIKPYLQYWEKPGMTPEGRRRDSVGCGAGNTDYVGFNGPSLKNHQRPGETEKETESRLMQDWHTCMRGKDYRYVAATPTK
jgi:hypothetical protein